VRQIKSLGRVLHCAGPNIGLEPTPYSFRSASASGRGSGPALGASGTEKNKEHSAQRSVPGAGACMPCSGVWGGFCWRYTGHTPESSPAPAV